jgi:hypothetical protein
MDPLAGLGARQRRRQAFPKHLLGCENAGARVGGGGLLHGLDRIVVKVAMPHGPPQHRPDILKDSCGLGGPLAPENGV